MTRLILVAAGGLLLATANTPPATTSATYPACSVKIRDRCVQRYERHASAPRAAAAARTDDSELSSVVAAEAPAPAAAPAYAASPAPRAAAPRPASRHVRAYRLAMRAGERG